MPPAAAPGSYDISTRPIALRVLLEPRDGALQSLAQRDDRQSERTVKRLGHLVRADFAGGIWALSDQRMLLVNRNVLRRSIDFARGCVHDALHAGGAGGENDIERSLDVGPHIRGRR